MSSTSTIFLNNPDDIVVIYGKVFTVDELQQELIDAHILKGRLAELRGDKE